MSDLYLGYPDENIVNWIKENYVDYSKIPFHFEVFEQCKLKIVNVSFSKLHEISLLYSLNNKTWNDWNFTSEITLNANQKFYIKAKTENKSFTNYIEEMGAPFGTYCFMLSNPITKINVAGNIMSLLYNDFIDKKEFETDSAYNFYNLFYKFSSTYITGSFNVSSLILPATTLTKYCYSNMFNGCTSLVNAPKLPATTFAIYCYQYMFTNCLAIKKLHYPKSLQNDSTFTSMSGSPWFGATNATIYYDL